MKLTIGDAHDWTFVNSTWTDTPTGGIAAERTADGDGWQGYCLAFYKPLALSDVDATFTLQLNTGHADVGLIFRAQDPTHYYLIHFPQGGQSYRAQHFWAALSLADGSGYLRLLRLELVRRVASNPFGLTHRARVLVQGDRFRVWLNGHPALDVCDPTYQSGRLGLAGFNAFAHGAISVTGAEVPTGDWDERTPQVKNWFVPFPDSGTQQRKVSLTRAPNGDLLCAFVGSGQLQLGRSADRGLTWSAAPAPQNMEGQIALLQDGRLISVSVLQGHGSWSQSLDNGHTWTSVTPISPAAPWPADPARTPTSYQFQLRDGTLIRFGVGAHSTSTEPITRWGAAHLQAFAIRSTDGGKTWSAPANLDATDREDMGNFDLTEPVAFETHDGRLMCLIRPIYSPWMWETWSDDQGRTWSPCVRGPFPGYAPSTPVRVSSGVVLFPTRFPGVTMHLTRDDGMTWDDGGGGTYLDTSIWAMGSLLEVEPNLVLFIYMDSWHDRLRAQFIHVTDTGLMPSKRHASLSPPTPNLPPPPETA